MSLIIFTGLDEILLPAETCDYQLVTDLIDLLQKHQIPLIPVTNNTRSEVEALLETIKLDSPFIVEQGSALFLPQENQNFALVESENLENYQYRQLGCSYTEARAALKVVQEEIGKILRGFGDMDESDIQLLIGGSMSSVHHAKEREFSEYFLTPNRIPIEELQQVALEYGFKISLGGKLSLITGSNADTVKAIKILTSSFLPATETIITAGLGSTSSDLSWLAAVDVPIVIPNDSAIKANLISKDWKTSSEPGIKGWITSIQKVLSQYLK